MAIQNLEILTLRNLRQAHFVPSSGLNFILGPNGSGKTSILEAIYCLGHGKSFRSHKLNHLITHDAPYFQITAGIETESRVLTIGVRRHWEQTDIRLAGQEVKKAGDLASMLPIAVIEPGLHQIIEGGPENRRRFLDWGVFHVEPDFRAVWNRYRRALLQRNAALKAKSSPGSIQTWDRELVTCANQLDTYRRHYVSDLVSVTAPLMDEFEGQVPVSLNYVPGWKSDRSFQETLMESLESDRERGFTQYGPHRADIRITTATGNAKDELSRGQQKLCMTALILGQCLHLQSRGRKVTVIVDDLPAELDEQNRNRLIRTLDRTGLQVFITATDGSLFDYRQLPGCKVFHVKHGAVMTTETGKNEDTNQEKMV